MEVKVEEKRTGKLNDQDHTLRN